MKLWILGRKDDVDWDENRGFIIRAETAQEARRTASLNASDEGAETWIQPQKSTCKELREGGRRGIILRDFNAG